MLSYILLHVHGENLKYVENRDSVPKGMSDFVMPMSPVLTCWSRDVVVNQKGLPLTFLPKIFCRFMIRNVPSASYRKRLFLQKEALSAGLKFLT